MKTRLLIISANPVYGCLHFPLPGVQFVQQFVDAVSVRTIGQGLFEQTAKTSQVAFKASQFQPEFFVFQAGHRKPQADSFAESRK